MTNNKDGNPPDIWQKECQEIINTKKISAIHKIKHWIDIFDNVAQYDETNEAKLKINSVLERMFWGLALFPMLTFYSLGWYWIMAGFFVVLAVIFHFIEKSKNKANANIENHFRLYTLPLFRILQQEASPNARLKLNVDFNRLEQKTYLIQNIPDTSNTYPQIDTNFYKITWLNAEVAFADKSQVEITVTDLSRIRTIRKRNPRGKIKMKTKHKIKQTITVKILFDKTQYQPSPETSTTQKLVEQADGYSIKIKTYNAIKTINTNINYDQYIDINPLLSAIAQAYAAVKPI